MKADVGVVCLLAWSANINGQEHRTICKLLFHEQNTRGDMQAWTVASELGQSCACDLE